MPTSPPTNVIDSGRFAWRAVSSLAADTDRAAEGISELTAGVGPLLGALRQPDAAAVPHAAQSAAARELAVAAARLRHAAQQLEVAAASLVARTELHAVDADRTARRWLARHSGLSHREASEYVRAAETCERFTQVGEAFHRGELTLAEVGAIGNIVPARLKGEALDAALAKVADIQGS